MNTPRSSGEVVVETSGLTKRYGGFTALDDLNLQVRRGQILGFIGPNGAGKSTTIRILVGLARPTSGSASIAGVDCVRHAQRIRRLVGYMPDVFGGYGAMRVREYLDFFAASYRIPRKQRISRVEEVLALTGSTYMADLYLDALSHGMKQRVGLARALVHDPEVLILDEPANGLDPSARIEMRQMLLKLAEMGKTLIVTSHILPELSRICDQVAIITRGKLRASGTLDQIMRTITHRRIIEVQLLRESQASRAASLLRQRLEDEAQVIESPAETMVRFRTEHDDRRLASLLADLVKAGVEIAQFREVPLDLEDAFLRVTERDRRTGAGDAEASSTGDSAAPVAEGGARPAQAAEAGS